MRIAILGATGGTGRAVAGLALAEGHEVTALVRDPARLALTSGRLRVLTGDALRADDVDAAITGQDAVFVSLGLSAGGSATEVVTVCTDGISNVLAAMARHRVDRVVAMSTHGVNDSDDGSPYVRALWEAVGERLKDKQTMEPLIRRSPTVWTIVRAPLISPEPPRGPFRAEEKIAIDATSSISHANLARFVLDELTEPRHAGQALSITE
jgi:putative NADH-flavin reductase